MGVANVVCSYTMLTVHLESCVPSGLNFEAADCYVLHYCLSNYLLQGHRGAVYMTWDQDGTLLWLNAKHSKEHPPPSLVDL